MKAEEPCQSRRIPTPLRCFRALHCGSLRLSQRSPASELAEWRQPKSCDDDLEIADAAKAAIAKLK